MHAWTSVVHGWTHERLPQNERVRVIRVDGGERSVRELSAALADALDGGPPVLPLSTCDPGAQVLRDAMRPDAPVEPGTSIILATSGSTGMPKGVLLSAGALRASATATHARLGGAGGWLLATPAHYIGGVQVLVRSLLAETSPAVLDLSEGFRAEEFARAAAGLAGGAAPLYTALVPTQLARLLDAGGAALDALRVFDAVLIGGARMPTALRARAVDAGVHIIAAYGSSETAGGCVYDGVPLDGVRVRLEPEGGPASAPRALGHAGATGTTGHVCIAGDVLTHGYRLDPERTRAALRDGWFHTDDIGRFAPDGTLEVLGRADDVINTGGVKVPAGSVERALLAHVGVREACVVGLPDAQWGELVAAVVVPADPSAPPTPAALTAFVREREGAPAAPKLVRVLGELPLRGPGKVDRAAVRALLLDALRGPREQ